jgi:Domain of unknown function (DUF5615)
MARLLADEQFDLKVVNALRRLGHDVETVRQHSVTKSGDGMQDEDVLSLSRAERRTLVTENFSDFKPLHERKVAHWGIIACSPANREPARARAKRIEALLKSNQGHIKQHFVRLYSWKGHR